MQLETGMYRQWSNPSLFTERPNAIRRGDLGFAAVAATHSGILTSTCQRLAIKRLVHIPPTQDKADFLPGIKRPFLQERRQGGRAQTEPH